MTGFKVAGVLDGALYEVEVTGNKSDPIVGSKRVRGLLRQYEGETVLVTPVGPAYDVDPGSPESLLALLVAKTRVTRVGDGAPRLVEEKPAGAIW